MDLEVLKDKELAFLIPLEMVEKRAKERDIVDWILTRILDRVTLSATIQCRTSLARELKQWIVKVYVMGFALGTACGAIGAILVICTR